MRGVPHESPLATRLHRIGGMGRRRHVVRGRLVPGPGSALYRGLGIVMVGGMTLNTAFLLLLLPALLRLRERPAHASTAHESIGESPCEPLPARP